MAAIAYSAWKRQVDVGNLSVHNYQYTPLFLTTARH